MAAAEYDMLDIEAAATYERKFVWRTADGTRVDISDYILRMRMADCEGETFLELSTGILGRDWTPEDTEFGYSDSSTIRFLDPMNGEFSLFISAYDTNDVCLSGVYDLYATRDDGYNVRLLRGRFNISKNVTNMDWG